MTRVQDGFSVAQSHAKGDLFHLEAFSRIATQLVTLSDALWLEVYRFSLEHALVLSVQSVVHELKLLSPSNANFSLI